MTVGHARRPIRRELTVWRRLLADGRRYGKAQNRSQARCQDEFRKATSHRFSKLVECIPLLAEEGWREAPGWSVRPKRFAELTTPSAPRFAPAHPPLLCEEGNVRATLNAFSRETLSNLPPILDKRLRVHRLHRTRARQFDGDDFRNPARIFR